MTFLNYAFLAALALGGLPILIHLLNRQRFKKIDFPTLRFLHELQRQKMRQVRIRQIILLALRTLAILFLVFALTRPVLKSSAGILPGVEARTTAILILDRSASMNAETAGSTRFHEIQTRAQEILALLKDGDEAQIIWADNSPVLFPENPSTNIRLLREAVTETRVANSGGSLVESLKQARSVLGRSQNLHKEVYVLSDFSVSAWPEKLPDVALLPSDVRLFLLPTDNGSVRDVGITNASIVSRLITPGRPVELSFEVRNSGKSTESDRIVSVYVSGRRVAQTRVTLAAGEVKTQHLKFVPESAGDQTGYVRLDEADDFSSDDQCYFVLRVPSQIHTAVVGNDGSARDLVTLALNPSADPVAFMQAKQYTTAVFESEDWSQFDAIFIVDAVGFGIGFQNRIRAFVENGKGVFVMLGPQADIRSYNSWLPSLGLPVLGEIWEGKDSPAKWNSIDFQHPLFEGLFEEKPADISPQVSKLVRTSGGTAVQVISTSAGIPFLLESKVGRGRALMMTCSPDPSWSSLFRSGIFPPLLVSSAAYLSGVGTSGGEYQLNSGVASTINFAGTPGDERYELKHGDDITALAVETAPAGFVLKIPAMDAPGDYALWQGNRRLTAVTVNVPAKELELQPAPESGYRSCLGGQITALGATSQVQTAIMEGRYGRELWKLCLYLALLMLALEMIVGRVGKRDVVAA